MNYADLLPERHWLNLVADQGRRTAPATATAARRWLIEQLSGAPVSITGEELQWRGASTDRMRTTLTPQLVDTLDTIATQFLQTHGAAGEPPTWSPPLSLLEGLTLPGTPPDTVDPNTIHELAMSGCKVPAIARQLHTSVWKVRYQLEHHPIGTGPQTRPTIPAKGSGSGSVAARLRAVLSDDTQRRLRVERGLPTPRSSTASNSGVTAAL